MDHRVPCQTEGCGGQLLIRIEPEGQSGIRIAGEEYRVRCGRCQREFRIIQLASGVGILPA